MVKQRRNKANNGADSGLITMTIEEAAKNAEVVTDEVIEPTNEVSEVANEIIETTHEVIEATNEVIEAFETTHEVIEAFEATNEVIEATNEELKEETSYLPPIKMTLRQWQRLVKPEEELIVAASIQDSSDAWQPWPIGISYLFSDYNGSLDPVMVGTHNKTVFCGFLTATDAGRRKVRNRSAFAQTLASNGIANEYAPDAGIRYYLSLPNYKFVICPEGNGIDTHRLYEALMAGCIPIVERRPHMADKYKGCPILYTTDYSEINELYLREKYEQMANKEWDFSNLYLSTYSDEEQAQIKANSDFWCRTFRVRRWY